VLEQDASVQEVLELELDDDVIVEDDEDDVDELILVGHGSRRMEVVVWHPW